MGHERAGCELLFRRNLAADRGRRRHGHGHPDRGAVDHASLRRLYAALRTNSRPPDLVNIPGPGSSSLAENREMRTNKVCGRGRQSARAALLPREEIQLKGPFRWPINLLVA